MSFDSRLRRIEERLRKLEQPLTPEEQKRYERVVNLTPDEQVALAYVIRDYERAGNIPDFEAWLATRPVEQREAFWKVNGKR